MKRVGLAVMRCQPLHKGHTAIINEMIQDCESSILMLGSTQAKGDQWNPWNFEQRKEMVQNVYGNRLKIFPIKDLGTDSATSDWCRWVMQKIVSAKMGEPTDYYTGSEADAIWYKNHFVMDGEEDPDVVKRAQLKGGEYRRLHILHRDRNPIPPASDIRTFLQMNDESWKEWVPKVNWEFIENTFPDDLKYKIEPLASESDESFLGMDNNSM